MTLIPCTFADCEEAAKAVEVMNKTQLWGRIIKVDFSRSFPKTSREMALRSSLSSSTTSVAGLLAAPFPSASVPRVTSPRLIVSGNSRCSSRSVSFRYWRRRRRCSSESSSSSSRSSCSCRRRSRRYRNHSSSSYRSRSRSSGSVTYRKVIYNGTGSPVPKSICRSRYFLRKQKVIHTDLNGTDCCESETFVDELPDSVVVAANLLHSSAVSQCSDRSSSCLSVGSLSSHSPRRKTTRKRTYHRRRHSRSASHSSR
ncbi:Serine/arginine-rich splicing factor 10 [Paragonimus heterotremus]|uniref:Serine/arginine-rich splicing factor 10 n=1 Tax=Paragonimus heterotremus TaxID=100268 RepID=A0A8J4WPI7_9TREM|nr:Serine/arginine-rich splicing factor 10 [Paragonimus heterotremus]